MAPRAFTLRYPAPTAPAWTPASLPSLIAWFDASSASSITSAGGKVSQVNDLSGNGHHLVQATGANQPTTGVATIGGLNAIGMTRTTSQWMTAPIGTLTDPVTILFVTHQGFSNPPPANDLLFFDSNDGAHRHASWPHNTGANIAWSMNAGSDVSTTKVVNTATDLQAVAAFNGASSTFYMGGTQFGGTLNPGTATMGNLTIGADSSHNSAFAYEGSWGEFVVMNAAISAGDRTNWNTYCAKWGL